MIFPIIFYRIFWKFIFLGFLQNRTFCGASGALKELRLIIQPYPHQVRCKLIVEVRCCVILIAKPGMPRREKTSQDVMTIWCFPMESLRLQHK